MLKRLPLPLRIFVDTDMKDTKQHCVYVVGFVRTKEGSNC